MWQPMGRFFPTGRTPFVNKTASSVCLGVFDGYTPGALLESPVIQRRVHAELCSFLRAPPPASQLARALGFALVVVPTTWMGPLPVPRANMVLTVGLGSGSTPSLVSSQGTRRGRKPWLQRLPGEAAVVYRALGLAGCGRSGNHCRLREGGSLLCGAIHPDHPGRLQLRASVQRSRRP